MTAYDFDVVIVGAGPAGSAAALRLGQLRPGMASRVLLLDKAVFPRPKLCGGGITHRADALLTRIDAVPLVRSTPIHRVRFQFPGREFLVRRENAFRVVRREDFDAALVQAASGRGIVVRQGALVTDLFRAAAGVTLRTPERDYTAKLVIGADGANGLVRRRVGLAEPAGGMMALRVIAPVDDAERLDRVEHGNRAECDAEGDGGHEPAALFDFRPVIAGLRGYYWEFPVVSDGLPLRSCGVVHAKALGGAGPVALKALLGQRLRAGGIDLEALQLQGHPARWFDPSARHSAARVVLAGDAMGTDPLFGEGITSALESGVLAAHSAIDALDRDDFSFSRHERRLRASLAGRMLHARLATARCYYASDAPWHHLAALWGWQRALRLWSRVSPRSAWMIASSTSAERMEREEQAGTPE